MPHHHECGGQARRTTCCDQILDGTTHVSARTLSIPIHGDRPIGVAGVDADGENSTEMLQQLNLGLRRANASEVNLIG
jgi:hypothetical protein